MDGQSAHVYYTQQKSPRVSSTGAFLYVAGVEGLEPPAPGFGDPCLYSDK